MVMWIHEGGERIEEQAFLGERSIEFFTQIEERLGRSLTAKDMMQVLEILCGQVSEEQTSEIIERLAGNSK